MPAFKRIDLSQIPSGQPPEGVMPNFVDPESIGYIPRIGIYILLPLMLIFLALRIGTRVKLNHVGADDSTWMPHLFLPSSSLPLPEYMRI